MPLRDHFRSPLDDITAWEGFHGGWPMVIVQLLGKKLPDRYVAAPRVHTVSHVEIDVATFKTGNAEELFSELGETNGGVATAVWAPPKPTFSAKTELPELDEFEVRIYDTRRGRRLVAAIEIVSPANKDRPEHRRLFVAKCAALLQQHVAVTIIDVVTIGDCNFYAELLDLLGQNDPDLEPEPASLYAVSCRWRANGDTHPFEAWNQTLHLGEVLPTTPLWIADDFAIPLELEASYEKTRQDLRIL